MSRLEFHTSLTKTDPQAHPVLIIGQLHHLQALKFDDLKCKLEPRITAETLEVCPIENNMGIIQKAIRFYTVKGLTTSLKKENYLWAPYLSFFGALQKYKRFSLRDQIL